MAKPETGFRFGKIRQRYCGSYVRTGENMEQMKYDYSVPDSWYEGLYKDKQAVLFFATQIQEFRMNHWKKESTVSVLYMKICEARTHIQNQYSLKFNNQ